MDRQARIEWLVDHYNAPRHRGRLEDAEVSMPGGNPECGDVVTMHVKADAEGRRIAGLAFEGEGCTISQAAASILTDLVLRERKTLDEIREMSYSEMMEILGKEMVSTRPRCATLALGTLKAAVKKLQWARRIAEAQEGAPLALALTPTSRRARLPRHIPSRRRTVTQERSPPVQQTLPIDPAGAGPGVRGAVPEPYEAFHVGDAWVFALPRMADRVREAMASAGSLSAYAESHPQRAALPAGRGPIYRIPGSQLDWVVRRYRRGGWMRWLGDRHLRVGPARPFAELRVSVEVRSRGVPTPEVLAGAVYPAGLFYRADLVTAYIPESYDLATLLFGPQPLEGEERKVAWAEAGRLLRWLYSLGVIHTDLNLRNILLERCARPPRPYLLDLDRCRVAAHVTPSQRRRMRKRFRRSAETWSRATGRPIPHEEWHAFQAAYRTKRV